MFLTRFQFNPQRRGAQKLLASPHALHAAVLSGFAEESESETGRVLWRLDSLGLRAILYIVSPDAPDLTHLVEQAGWPTTQTWVTKPYAPLLDQLEPGDRFAFRLTANPIHNVRQETGTRGKPIGHVTVAEQEKWLLARQERSGFEVTHTAKGDSTLSVSDRRALSFRRGAAQVTLTVATYQGILQITDADQFRRVLVNGLGRAKGYGCGLLTIANEP